ncbi:methyltransferase domain-containing protein [Desulfobacter vibrioformis]|uniref:methyltransferase domain-containing protein n=1 Tax=Desulfobacter vibrioformis TaxID=34031 RepID=UPI000557AC4B|nr:methyltransferase domain-containing protein [Desulfobacter vibrioformis]
MPLTAILCCYPRETTDIIFSGREKPLITAALKGLMAHGSIGRIVVSSSEALPGNCKQALEGLGLEVHYSRHIAPQKRLLEVMNDLNLNQACILNGYSFLIDAEQTSQLERLVHSGKRHAACVNTRSPFRYQAVITLDMVRRLAEKYESNVNPLKLHTALPASEIGLLDDPGKEFIGLDGLLWLILVYAMQSNDQTLVREIQSKMRRDLSMPKAVQRVFREKGIELAGQENGWNHAELFKACSLVQEYFTDRQKRLESVHKGRFLEIGYGDAPYSAMLHSLNFAKGVAIEPFSLPGNPNFKANKAQFARLLPTLSALLPEFNLPRDIPCTVTFETGFLDTCAFPREFFDYCFSVTVLEHVQNVAALMRELQRIMRPGAAMHHVVDYSGHIFCKDNRFPFYSFTKAQWLAKTSTLNLLRRSEIITDIQNAGFEVTVLNEERSMVLPDDIAPDWREYCTQDLTTVSGSYWCVKT